MMVRPCGVVFHMRWLIPQCYRAFALSGLVTTSNSSLIAVPTANHAWAKRCNEAPRLAAIAASYSAMQAFTRKAYQHAVTFEELLKILSCSVCAAHL